MLSCCFQRIYDKYFEVTSEHLNNLIEEVFYMNCDQMKSTLLQALREVGAIIKEEIDKPKIIEKKSELSIVTEIDKKCDKLIVEIIKSTFPDHAFLTEEAPPEGNSENRWVIDPIDGTTNFAHSFPVVSVSIAYEFQGKVMLGGIYDPFRDELFFAERGKGATMNNKPISVSKTTCVRDALVATGFAYDRRERVDDYLEMFREFIMKSQGIRRGGSAAIDLCYVACGRFDVYYEQGLQPWDKAAGMLIVEEAGGQTSDYKGGPNTLEGRFNIASNGKFHQELIDILKHSK
jgi:myo-inositol-1(or 4)-monophosphatase